MVHTLVHCCFTDFALQLGRAESLHYPSTGDHFGAIADSAIDAFPAALPDFNDYTVG